MAEKTKKILVISLSCVGDAIMTTPVFQSLHERCPEAKIDIVSDRRSSFIYSHCPYLGEIFHKDKKKMLRGVVDLLKNINNKSYDLIIDLRTDALSYLIRGKKRFPKWKAKPYGKHAVEVLMGVIRSMHGDEPIPDTHIWLSDEHMEFADQSLASLPGDNWLSLAPGASGSVKRMWPAENYALLANSLSDIFSGVILLCIEKEKK